MSNESAKPTAPTPVDSASSNALSETAVQAVANRFRDAYDARNVDAFVELFSERGDWTLGAGTFAGKAAIRRVLEWDVRFSPTASSRPLGITSVVRGNVAVNERLLEQSAEGIPYMCPAVTVLELNEAGEIEHARSYYDGLAIFRQVASSRRRSTAAAASDGRADAAPAYVIRPRSSTISSPSASWSVPPSSSGVSKRARNEKGGRSGSRVGATVGDASTGPAVNRATNQEAGPKAGSLTG